MANAIPVYDRFILDRIFLSVGNAKT